MESTISSIRLREFIMKSFPYGRTFILGFGFFGISVIWPLFNSLIPPML